MKPVGLAVPDAPQAWILWRRRKGDLDQMLALVETLGWPYTIKTLSFRSPDVPVLAPLLLKRKSDPLSPPWPDVVICAEALPSIIARHLRKRSGGRIKTICLARPAGTPAAFDLVITTAQYRLPPAANILELAMPLSSGSSIQASASGDRATPRIAVAVGGPSFPDRLDNAVARDMAVALAAYAAGKRAQLDVVTSPRTDGAIADSLKAALPAPHRLHVFRQGADNPYRRLLAEASEIVVTSDSVSMVADALETGKPVSIYRLPQKRNMQWRITEWLYRNAVLAPSPWLKPLTWAFDIGLFEAAADRHLLFERLAAERRLSWFCGEPPVPQPEATARDLAQAADRAKALITSRH